MARNTKAVLVFRCNTCGEYWLAEDPDDEDCRDEARRGAEQCCPPDSEMREQCLTCEHVIAGNGSCGCGDGKDI